MRDIWNSMGFTLTDLIAHVQPLIITGDNSLAHAEGKQISAPTQPTLINAHKSFLKEGSM